VKVLYIYGRGEVVYVFIILNSIYLYVWRLFFFSSFYSFSYFIFLLFYFFIFFLNLFFSFSFSVDGE
jgi:hypothetical protein